MPPTLTSSKDQMSESLEHAETDAGESLASWTPATSADQETVREQVGRILSSVTFRNSKRFPAFLRFTVEHALTSREPLKERTIGHEVFDREPGYDTGQDPVVRMTAAEVRKRLTQYYAAPEHQNEVVIAYQPGSYVPEFFQRRRHANLDAATSPDVAAPGGRTSLIPVSVAAVGISVIVIAVLVATGAVGRGRNDDTADAASRFWAPIVASSSPALICIGDPTRVSEQPEQGAPQRSQSEDNATIEEFLRSNSVRYTDSVTLALLAGELRARRKPFRIRRPAATELKDLRDGPVILIGGFNNPWTLRLSQGWRFTLAPDPQGAYIRDRDRPDDRRWQREAPGSLMKNLRQTYGLITRVQDPATGHSVLTVSGLILGTGAAAECLLDADCMQAAEKLGANFSRTHVQVVVGAAVIGEDAGAPQVLAAHSW